MITYVITGIASFIVIDAIILYSCYLHQKNH